MPFVAQKTPNSCRCLVNFYWCRNTTVVIATVHLSGVNGRVRLKRLNGQPLLSNKSEWINFRVVNNQHWNFDNVVLLGDALRSVHFSIGSGTRMALEDAITLYQTFVAHNHITTALAEFETARQVSVNKVLSTARNSFIWYQNFHSKMHLDPLPFAYDYMRRGGWIDHDRLRQQAPGFVAAYEDYIASQKKEYSTHHR